MLAGVHQPQTSNRSLSETGRRTERMYAFQNRDESAQMTFSNFMDNGTPIGLESYCHFKLYLKAYCNASSSRAGKQALKLHDATKEHQQ